MTTATEPTIDEHEHFGPDCPQCKSMADQSRVLGGIGEAWQKMLDDGVFFRLGQEMARRREEAVFKAVFGTTREEAFQNVAFGETSHS